MKKVSIVGGGLSGLSLGIYLRKLGVPVVLYEAGKYPKHKVCGEFICGVKETILYEMGLDVVIDNSLNHHTMEWAMGDEVVLRDDLPMVAYGLSRYTLDEVLSEQFKELGGELRLGERMPADSMEKEGVVRGVGKKKSTGKQQWVGLKIHATEATDVSGLEMHVGYSGYIGLCEVEDQRVNCCGLFELDRSIRGGDILKAYLRKNGLNDLVARMDTWRFDEASFSSTAGFKFGVQDQQDDFCIGDAAYLIPPFTGNGMSMAIESAYLAGQLLERYSKGQTAWAQCRLQYQKHIRSRFQKRMALAMTLHPLLFNKTGISLISLSARMGVLPFPFLFNQLRTP